MGWGRRLKPRRPSPVQGSRHSIQFNNIIFNIAAYLVRPRENHAWQPAGRLIRRSGAIAAG